MLHSHKIMTTVTRRQTWGQMKIIQAANERHDSSEGYAVYNRLSRVRTLTLTLVYSSSTTKHKSQVLGRSQIKKVNPYLWGVFALRPYAKGSVVISSDLIDKTPNPKATSCSLSIQTNGTSTS